MEKLDSKWISRKDPRFAFLEILPSQCWSGIFQESLLGIQYHDFVGRPLCHTQAVPLSFVPLDGTGLSPTLSCSPSLFQMRRQFVPPKRVVSPSSGGKPDEVAVVLPHQVCSYIRVYLRPLATARAFGIPKPMI